MGMQIRTPRGIVFYFRCIYLIPTRIYLRFLLPALQINDILGQTNIDEVRRTLKTLPRGLSESLALTMERIEKQHGQSQSRSRLALAVLLWLSMA